MTDRTLILNLRSGFFRFLSIPTFIILLCRLLFFGKEWDDPSVVPGKETYDDWADVCGLNAAGRTSVFPHMTDQWQELADRRTEKVLERTGSGSEDSSEPAPSVRFIRDNQAYIVDGKRQSIAEL